MRLNLLCLVIFGLLIFCINRVEAHDNDEDFLSSVQKKVELYQKRYSLTDVFEKRVDNHGDGFDPLYGTRNFRAVLNGLVYRGGANNVHNKFGSRANENPLPKIGIQNLCQEGFSETIYLYQHHFSQAPHSLSCKSLSSDSSIIYEQISPTSDTALRRIFYLVQLAATNPSKGPLYLHCWNGWHTSGLASALILRQFCGMSAEQAVQYWDRNTDGNNRSHAYESFRRRIRSFQPFAEYMLPKSIHDLVCPQLSN